MNDKVKRQTNLAILISLGLLAIFAMDLKKLWPWRVLHPFLDVIMIDLAGMMFILAVIFRISMMGGENGYDEKTGTRLE